MEKIKIIASKPIRLDKFLAETLNISRTKIQKLINENKIKVNNHTINKVNYELQNGQEIELQYNKKHEEYYLDKNIEPYDSQLEVLFEDQYFLIVNKPSGVISHPTQFNEQNTILNIAKAYFLKNNIDSDPWLVHRLDKDTSGILVIAKNNDALLAMQKLFDDKSVIKKYYALVHNCLYDQQMLIDVPIARSYQNKLKMNAIHGKNPKPAQTKINLIENYQQAALVECQLLTGRTHQIRVHLKHINHPILNDPLYGCENKCSSFGQYLHAYFIAFKHPFTGQKIELRINVPLEFEEKIKILKN